MLTFIKEGHFDYLGAFAYSREDKTPAARLRGQIPNAVKADRLTALTDTFYEAAYAKAQKRIGTTETLVLDEMEGDAGIGRTRREAPEIDAIVRIPRFRARPNPFLTVRITDYDAYEFTATPV
jgi:ribosomal protein S12 methylthiotransferase